MNKQAVRVVKQNEQASDFAYWQSVEPLERLAALEEIRQEYISWKDDTKKRFQRVCRVIKQK